MFMVCTVTHISNHCNQSPFVFIYNNDPHIRFWTLSKIFFKTCQINSCYAIIGMPFLGVMPMIIYLMMIETPAD